MASELIRATEEYQLKIADKVSMGIVFVQKRYSYYSEQRLTSLPRIRINCFILYNQDQTIEPL